MKIDLPILISYQNLKTNNIKTKNNQNGKIVIRPLGRYRVNTRRVLAPKHPLLLILIYNNY